MADRKNEGNTQQLKERRREAGRWLRALREQKGISSGAEMNRRLGGAPENFRWVLAIEGGQRALPTAQIEGWARVLGMPASDLARSLLRIYEPLKFAALYGRQEQAEPRSKVNKWIKKSKPTGSR